MPVYGPSYPSARLLDAKLYDPAGLVTKSTGSLLAMTAFDTTNLRITFTVPANGTVRVIIRAAGHTTGGTQTPAVLLGVMSGAAIAARRMATVHSATNTTSTVFSHFWADFAVPGLTPGATLTWDAAYGVEATTSGSNIKYGGPDDTTGANAFGAFSYEIWTTG